MINGFRKDELFPTASRRIRTVEFLELGRMVKGDRMKRKGENKERKQI